MYYGHLNHKKYSDDDFDLSHYNYRYHGGEGILPTIICPILLFLFVGASIISYKVTERPAPDGTHVHWTWFGKPMIYENHNFRSHHFMHQERCPMCKEIIDEMKK